MWENKYSRLVISTRGDFQRKNDYKNNNPKFSLFNDTYEKVSEVLQKRYTGVFNSSRGRKQHTPTVLCSD